MQEFVSIYNKNKNDIKDLIVETLNNFSTIKNQSKNNYEKLFKIFNSLELLYICNKKDLKQISANIYRKRVSNSPKGNSREYLLDKLTLIDDNLSISNPYISSASGNICITIAKKEDDIIYFLDFNLSFLLQKLGLIEIHNQFNLLNKSFYLISATIMIILSFFTVIYSLYEFVDFIFFKHSLSIESIFKPVIALTLGLAIFDLAKTILEQEVIFKNYTKDDKTQYNILIKFSITIIIALLIESLMVVFKIAIDNYMHMIYAMYLIAGVSILIVSLGFFIYYTNKKAS